MSQYTNYESVIFKNLFLNPFDWYFKSDKDYTGILEHVVPEYAILILEEIKKDFNDLFYNNLNIFISLANINDTYGKTVKYDFKDFCICSPSNIRYIYQSLSILSHMKNINLNDIDIIEIGGGYGGLCFYLKKLSYLFEINIKSYHIFDLLPVAKLQELYLKHLDINNVTSSALNDNYELKNNSFLISNYGISEFDVIIRNEYYDKVISKYVSNGYLIWNTSDKCNIINKQYHLKPEKPFWLHDNGVYYW